VTKQLFKLFACCLPVKGHSRSVICDVQRKNFDFIPNDLFDMLQEQTQGIDVSALKDAFSEEEKIILDEYFQFLIEKEYGFWCDNEDAPLFPPISLKWESPLFITNAILDIGAYAQDQELIASILKQLDELGCSALEIRCFDPESARNAPITSIIASTEKLRIKTVEIILPFYQGVIEHCFEIVELSGRVNKIIIHSVPAEFMHLEESGELTKDPKKSKIHFLSSGIADHTHCGVIAPGYFSINLPTFAEAQLHNTCLNRKISIDVHGVIKNCPSMTSSYGSIKTTTLQEAIDTLDFKKYWTINKDKIDGCKDCEFRYICTDCRAYLTSDFSKPKKCNYDPYTATWN
jgi:SPASM domain peptide maturase of grasp-with-spasm system